MDTYFSFFRRKWKETIECKTATASHEKTAMQIQWNDKGGKGGFVRSNALKSWEITQEVEFLGEDNNSLHLAMNKIMQEIPWSSALPPNCCRVMVHNWWLCECLTKFIRRGRFYPMFATLFRVYTVTGCSNFYRLFVSLFDVSTTAGGIADRQFLWFDNCEWNHRMCAFCITSCSASN
jgi:hypothetical protein